MAVITYSQRLPGWRVNLEGLHRSDPTPGTCLLYCRPWPRLGPWEGHVCKEKASWAALSRQLALLFPPGRADTPWFSAAPACHIPPPRPRSLAAGKPGAPSCILGNVVLFSPGGRSSEESQACTPSLGHVSPAASPTPPLRMDRQDTSAGDFLHWGLHRPLATFLGTVSSGACGFSVLSGPHPDPSPRLCWGSRSGRW